MVGVWQNFQLYS